MWSRIVTMIMAPEAIGAMPLAFVVMFGGYFSYRYNMVLKGNHDRPHPPANFRDRARLQRHPRRRNARAGRWLVYSIGRIFVHVRPALLVPMEADGPARHR
jgi:hypothetical protein